jgi:hypothetical protein
MCFTEVCCEGVNWLHLAQKQDLCRALVNTVMYFLLYKYGCTLLEDDLKERVETCQIPSALTVRTLY